MKQLLITIALAVLSFITSCAQQTGSNNRSSGCEGCEAIYESPVPFDQLDSMVWLPDWKEEGTRLAVNGTVYKPDGTPAAGVIIYIYHTDQKGVYPTKGNEKGWAKRHGYLRGWMKTNEKGFYKFFTLKPASYPEGKTPAHIHVIIKEPGKAPYWIDEYVFDDDPLLTDEDRKQCKNRGGSGILTFKDYFKGKKSQKAERHIYLGKNM